MSSVVKAAAVVGLFAAFAPAATVGSVAFAFGSTLALGVIANKRQDQPGAVDIDRGAGGGAIRTSGPQRGVYVFGRRRVGRDVAWYGESSTVFRAAYPISWGEIEKIAAVWSPEHGTRVPMEPGRVTTATWISSIVNEDGGVATSEEQDELADAVAPAPDKKVDSWDDDRIEIIQDWHGVPTFDASVSDEGGAIYSDDYADYSPEVEAISDILDSIDDFGDEIASDDLYRDLQEARSRANIGNPEATTRGVGVETHFEAEIPNSQRALDNYIQDTAERYGLTPESVSRNTETTAQSRGLASLLGFRGTVTARTNLVQARLDSAISGQRTTISPNEGGGESVNIGFGTIPGPTGGGNVSFSTSGSGGTAISISGDTSGLSGQAASVANAVDAAFDAIQSTIDPETLSNISSSLHGLSSAVASGNQAAISAAIAAVNAASSAVTVSSDDDDDGNEGGSDGGGGDGTAGGDGGVDDGVGPDGEW